MKMIYQIHEILGISMSGGGGIIPRNLIAPGTVKGIFRDPHQLHMGIFHFLQVFYHAVGKFPVIIISVLGSVRMLHPGTDMALIDGKRLLIHILFPAFFHPALICPGKTGKIGHDGSRSRAELCIIGKRICFVKLSSVLCRDQELIHGAFLYTRYKQCPDAARPQLLHGMAIFIPVIKASDHMHLCRIGCPDTKEHTFHTIFLRKMCTQLFINIIMGSLGKYILVCLRNKHRFSFWFFLFCAKCHFLCPL